MRHRNAGFRTLTLAAGLWSVAGDAAAQSEQNVVLTGCISPAGNSDAFVLTGLTGSAPNGRSAFAPTQRMSALQGERADLVTRAGQRVAVTGVLTRQAASEAATPVPSSLPVATTQGLPVLRVQALADTGQSCCAGVADRSRCVDQLAGEFIRDRVMEAFARSGNDFEKLSATRYAKEQDLEVRAQLHVATISARLLQDLNLLPSSERRPTGLGFWRTLTLTLGGQFMSVNLAPLIASSLPVGSIDPFAFNPAQSNRRAQIGDALALDLVARHLSPEAATTFKAASPLKQTQVFLAALRRSVADFQWPTAGLLALVDTPRITVVTALAKPVRGGYAEELVGVLLGRDNVDYGDWNVRRGERERAAIVLRALDDLFARGERVVADTPTLAPSAFKAQIDFKRWVYNADEDERTVAEAFGIAGLERFRRLSGEARRSGQRSQELDDLYRAAVVRAVVWHWAAYLAL